MKKRISIILAVIMIINIILGSIPLNVEAKEVTLNQSNNNENKEEEQIKLSQNNMKLISDKKETLSYHLIGLEDKDIELRWVSDDESIATVDGGEVTGLNPGKTIIRLESKNGKFSDECNVEVKQSSIVPHISQSSKEEQYTFILSANKNYEIVNNMPEELKIQNDSGNGSSFNIVQYNEDKTIDAIFRNENGTLILGPSMRLKISVVGDVDIQCNISKSQKENITLKEVENPAIDEYNISSNQNIKIENLSQEKIYISNNSGINTSYEYVQYNADKTVKKFELDVDENIQLEGNEEVKISAYDKEVNICYPWEDKEKIQITEENEKPIYKRNLQANRNYEIRNIANQDIEIKNNSDYYSRYDIVRYNEDNTIKEFDRNIYGSINIKNDLKLKIHLYNKDIEFYIPTDYKKNYEINEVIEEPLFKFNLDPNKNYEIRNTSDNKITLINDSGYYKRYDSIYYKSDNNIKEFYEYKYGNISLEKDEYTKIRTYDEGLEFWLPQEYKKYYQINEINKAPLHKFELEKDKSYKIYNFSSENITIKNSSSYYNRYDIIYFKTDGSYTTNIDKYGDIVLNKGEYVVVSNSQNNEENLSCFTAIDFYELGLTISTLEEDIKDIFELIPKVHINITKVMSKGKKDVENSKIKDSLSKYNIGIYNKTQDKHIGNIQIKNDYVILPTESVKQGDELILNIQSKNNSTIEVELRTTIDITKNEVLDVEVKELGYLKLKHNSLNDANLIKILLFNKNGEIIEHMSNNNVPTITKYLNEGEYIAVLLKAKGDLWRLNKLEELDNKGFKENEDYSKYTFNIKDGIIEEINTENIPIVDEEKLSFFNRDKTNFIIDTSSVVQGGNIEVRLAYSFKKQYNAKNIKNKYIRIYLDEGTTFIENSLILDNKSTNYNANNNYVEVPIENLEGVIKFYISVDDSKQSLNAKAYFQFNNNSMYETIGSIDVEADYITINGPVEVSSKNITVYGITKPKTKVNVYCDNNKLGQTISTESGKWKLNVDLPSTYSAMNYKLYAKVDEDTLNEKISNEINIKYKQSSIELEKIEMYYRDFTETKKLDLTKAFLQGDIPKYTYLPGHKFTFKVKMKNSQNIEKLYVTSERNNEEKRLEAIYDKENDIWIASGFFDPNDTSYVPGILNIVYVPTIESIMEPQLLDEWKNATVRVNETDEKIEYFIILDDKEKTPVKVTIEEKKSKNLPQEDIELSENGKKFGATMSTADEFLTIGVESLGNKTISDIFQRTSMYIDISEKLKLADRAFDWKKLNDIEKKDLASDILLNVVSTIASSGSNTFMDFIFEMEIELAKKATTDLIDLILNTQINWKKEEKVVEDGAKTKAKIDPSGYVYEAINSNKIEGVTATVYYQDENGQAKKWDAIEYDQINPLITDKEGRYEWFVPEGMWQVKYEKEGYETTYSEWLPVPPPQTEVNIGMVSLEKPSIELFNIYKDRVEVTFNKYMDVSTINTNSIKLNDSKGNEIPIKIEAFEKQESNNNKIVAKKFILKNNNDSTLLLNGEYTLKVTKIAKTYAGINSDSDIISKKIYKPLPLGIKVDGSYEVEYNKEISIPVSIDKISNAEEFEVMATSSEDNIVSIVTDKVKFNKDGKAIIRVLGQLSGETEITFKIEGLDLETKTKINVLLPNEVIKPNTLPVIEVKDLELKVGDEFKVLEGITAYDNEDGDITSKIKIVENTVNIFKAGKYKVVYSIEDSDGNLVTKERIVTITSQKIENLKSSSLSYNSNKITWGKVSGVNGYEVWRSTSKNGTYKLIKTITSGSTVSYTNTSLATGTTYYYKVRAYRTVNGKKAYSNYSSIVSSKPVLSSITAKVSSISYNSNKISWNKVSGANGYVVYRSTSKNGTYKSIKTITNGSTLSYTNTSLVTGTTYYYKVRAYRTVNGKKVYSNYSSIVSSKPVLSKPSFTLTAGTKKATVKWKKISGASGYEVYRATSKSGKYANVKTITKGSTLSFTNSSLSNKKTYYYKVRAYRLVNGKKVYSSYSSVKSVKTK